MSKESTEVRVKEILGFTYKDITVFVQIDYNTRQVSLIEKDGKPKQWVFANRGESYHGSWLTILDAMKNAINKASLRLEEQPSMLEKILMEDACKRISDYFPSKKGGK